MVQDRAAATSKPIHVPKQAQTQAQWKDKVRQGCIERAKLARRQRLRKSRSMPPINSSSIGADNGREGGGNEGDGAGLSDAAVGDCKNSSFNDSSGSTNNVTIRLTKRNREDFRHHHHHNASEEWDGMNESIVDHTPNNRTHNIDNYTMGNESGDSEENVVDTARVLVEQELQRALMGVQHAHQVCPLDGEGGPWKKQSSSAIQDHDMSEVLSGNEETNEEYKISHEEFVELLNDVTEELQREDELLEEEIWEMERAEAMERERLMNQIDDFESWEELKQQQDQYQQQQQCHNVTQPNTYISPLSNLNSQPLVPCPICNEASLMETPYDGIICNNATAASSSSSAVGENNDNNQNQKQCTFQLDIAHEGLTLNHLQNQLRTVYDDHSRICPGGILKFRMENRVGVCMLMAKCDVCSSDVVVL